MPKKEYYGNMSIVARIGFYAKSDKSIEDVKKEILDYNFDIKFLDDDYKEISEEKFSIADMEGEILEKATQGNVQQRGIRDFEIYEDK